MYACLLRADAKARVRLRGANRRHRQQDNRKEGRSRDRPLGLTQRIVGLPPPLGKCDRGAARPGSADACPQTRHTRTRTYVRTQGARSPAPRPGLSARAVSKRCLVRSKPPHHVDTRKPTRGESAHGRSEEAFVARLAAVYARYANVGRRADAQASASAGRRSPPLLRVRVPFRSSLRHAGACRTRAAGRGGRWPIAAARGSGLKSEGPAWDATCAFARIFFSLFCLCAREMLVAGAYLDGGATCNLRALALSAHIPAQVGSIIAVYVKVTYGARRGTREGSAIGLAGS